MKLLLVCLVLCLCEANRLRGSAGPQFSLPKCTSQLLNNPKGYMFDLDGTVHNNIGFIKGSPEIFDWLHDKKLPYSLLTNAFKTQKDVIDTLSNEPMGYSGVVDPSIVHTAGVALARYLEVNAQPRSRIFLLGNTFSINGEERSTYTMLKDGVRDHELFDSWRIRTDMTSDEIVEWGHHAVDHHDPVFVVIGGDIKFNGIVDPVTGKRGYTTLDFDLMTKMTILLRNGARLVCGASDRLEARQKSEAYPSVSTSWPAIGALEALLMTASNMKNEGGVEYHVGTGKGGSRGDEYMTQEALKIVKRNNPEMLNEEIVLVGDNLGTDIYAANQANMKSIFVLSGTHKLEDLDQFAGKPTCYLNDLSELPLLID